MKLKIAEVIVDVAAYPLDRPFDYLVPTEMEQTIEPGVRVKVPFGRRNVLGYVVQLKSETSITIDKMKSIQELIDIEPVLSSELLELSSTLATKTLAYRIDTLQVMLPAAMRAKYEKFIYINDLEAIEDQELLSFINNRQQIRLKEAERSASLLASIKKYVELGSIEVDTVVSQQTKVKKERVVTIVSTKRLLEIEQTIAKNAKRQKELLEVVINYAEQSVLASTLLKQADVAPTVLNTLIDKGIGVATTREVYREPTAPNLVDVAMPVQLTEEQDVALTSIYTAIEKKRDEVFLLHGITGSGKTEIYLQAIQKVLAKGQNAIVLVPEISLTPQMTARFKERFGPLVAVMHSALSSGEKYDEWRKIKREEVQVVVGARSAVFAPFDNIGLIILDEEHEATYKQEDTPRYHARDVAIERARYHQCPVILGSATPSLESYARASKNVYTLLTLTKRAVNENLPKVHVVDMREELRTGNRSMFSTGLMEALKARIKRNEQSILFLNRRGFSSFVLCRDCGTTVECPNCDISLTYHRASERLKCHYCGHEERVPLTCPQCDSEHIRFFGTGTQKVEVEIKKLLPEARILRMDVDTTRRKGSHEAILRKFSNGEADILLGTQMIAKGLDFPNITLVGVLAADTTLHLADFRASEKTFQLLTQVSGRAGRHELPGEVYVQTYSPEHYAIELAKEQQYEPFYKLEMAARFEYGYPPFYFFTLIQFTHEDVLKVAEYAYEAVSYLQENLSPETVIIGPTASAVSRVNNRFRYQCLIKYKQEPVLTETLQQLIKIYRTTWIKKGLQMHVDVDPVSIF